MRQRTGLAEAAVRRATDTLVSFLNELTAEQPVERVTDLVDRDPEAHTRSV